MSKFILINYQERNRKGFEMQISCRQGTLPGGRKP